MGGVKQRGPNRSIRELRRELNTKGGSAQSKAQQGDREQSQETKTAAVRDDSWCPATGTAWKLLLSARLCAAVWSGVSDCDEAFNYWEPTHHLIYAQGMQTWEYDPKYALRSYMYLMVHAVPAWLYAKLMQPNPMLVFYFLRCLLGCLSASCEVYFYRGVVEEFGVNVGRLTLAILTLSTGMFISSTAFLPSSTSMYLTLLAAGAWFRNNEKPAIFATALSAILSWPFTALLGVPIALDLLIFRRRFNTFIVWSAFSALAILGPILMCDTFYYGKPVFASLNIVIYNVLTDHGPDLYGTEPASFYLFNGLLNFNFVFPAALATLPLRYALAIIFGEKNFPTRGKLLPVWLSQLGMYLWLLIFWTQAHKEERFLFPAYPLIVLAGALALDTTQRLIQVLLSRGSARGYQDGTGWMAALALLGFGLLSLLRITALYQHYHGSTDVWMRVNELEGGPRTTIVCVGKEWYRFPSSFFLPDTSFKIGFLQSEFKGQLPKYYSAPRDGLLPTQITHDDFNDQNLEEPSRYTNPAKCHYIVDLEDGSETPRQPSYAGQPNWTKVMEVDFLDPSASHSFLRAFYVPFLNSRYCSYNKYLLLKRT